MWLNHHKSELLLVCFELTLVLAYDKNTPEVSLWVVSYHLYTCLPVWDYCTLEPLATETMQSAKLSFLLPEQDPANQERS